MKKLFYILFGVFVLSCSSENEKNNIKAESSMEDVNLIQNTQPIAIDSIEIIKKESIIDFVKWESLDNEEKEIITKEWNHFKQILKDENSDELLKYVSFPLGGEWGAFIGKTSNGNLLNNNDFRESIPTIFNQMVLKQLYSAQPGHNSFDMIKNYSDTSIHGFQVGVSLQEPEDDFESSRIFKFILQNDTFKLKSIFHAG